LSPKEDQQGNRAIWLYPGPQALFTPSFRKRLSSGTEPGKAALEQICAHEGAEPEPVGVDEEGAGFRAQGKGEQDEESGNDAYPAFGSHGIHPDNLVKFNIARG
jgi:hypothetical protein